MQHRRTTLRGTASLILAADAAIRMPEIGIESPLAALCEGFNLSDTPSDEDGNHQMP